MHVRTAALVALCGCVWLCGCAGVKEKAAKQGTAAVEEVVERRIAPAIEDLFIRRSLRATLEGGEKTVFRAFEEVRPKWRWQRFTTRDVKQFVRLFEAGTRQPGTYLNSPKVDADLIARWRGAPVEKRIFIAGANEDTPVIAQLRDKLSKDGNVVFFYRFCTGVAGVLCDSQTVGAFFATAGSAVAAFSWASEESRYLPNEIAAALNAKQGQTGILLFTPEDLMNAAERTTAARIATVSPDESQAKGK